MKIAVLYQSEFPPQNKILANDRRVNDISNAIQMFSEDVVLFTPNKKSSKFDQTKNDISLKSNFRIEKSKKYKLTNIILDRFLFLIDAYQFIKEKKISLVLFYNTTIECTFLMYLLRFKGIKVAVELCDLHSQSSTIKKWKGKGFYLSKLTEFINPKASNLHVGISNNILEYFAKSSPKKPYIKIPILVDIHNFKSKIKKEESIISIGICGSLWDYEGVDILMTAFAKLNEEYQNTHLVIIGDSKNNTNKTDISKLANELNIEKKISLSGFVIGEDLISWYDKCDILVLPQKKNGFTLAAFPTVLAEYCSMGKVLVLAKFGEVENYFKHLENCLFFEENNYIDLYFQLRKLVLDKELRYKLSIESRLTAEEYFSIEANSIILNKFFSENAT